MKPLKYMKKAGTGLILLILMTASFHGCTKNEDSRNKLALLALYLFLNNGNGGCESKGTPSQAPYSGKAIADPEIQDSDGDLVPDIHDDYPLDNTRFNAPYVEEIEFNNNINDAVSISDSFPFNMEGTLDSSVISNGNGSNDEDYYTFSALKGDRISVMVYQEHTTVNETTGHHILSLQSRRTFSFYVQGLKGDGSRLYSQVEISGQRNGFDGGIGIEIPEDGVYGIIVGKTNYDETNYKYPYTVKVFQDNDFDGVPDDLESALEMDPEHPDSDEDGLTDGAEIYSYMYTFEQKDAFDPDKDEIPNWYDVDSDSDCIPDGVETNNDSDGDTLGNFLDRDSDGNGIRDVKEAGASTVFPLDTDSDGVYDFNDPDDDNDGIPDFWDSERLRGANPEWLAKSIRCSEDEECDSAELSSGLEIYSTILKIEGNEIYNAARPGDFIEINGEGFRNSSKVSFPVEGGHRVIDSAKNVDENRMFVVVPEDGVSGKLYLFEKDTVSSGLDIQVIPQGKPFLYDLSVDEAQPGEVLKIFGNDLGSGETPVSFNGTSATGLSYGDYVTVTVPPDATTGPVSLVSGVDLTNSINLLIRKTVSGTIQIPAGMALDLTVVNVEYGNGENEYSTPSASGSFSIRALNDVSDHIHVMYKDSTGDSVDGIFMTAIVFPGDTAITISPESTALELVFTGLFLDTIYDSDNIGKVRDIVSGLEELKDLADLIETGLVNNKYYIDKFSNSELIDQYRIAAGAASDALETALITGTITKNSDDNFSPAAKDVTVEPSSSQYDVTVVETEGENGNITVKNDTGLYLSVKISDRNGYVLLGHTMNPFSPDMIAPQGGHPALNWLVYNTFGSSEKKFNQPRYKDGTIEIITPGISNKLTTSMTKEQNKVWASLLIKTVISQYTVSLLENIVDLTYFGKIDSSKLEKKVVARMVTKGTFQLIQDNPQDAPVYIKDFMQENFVGIAKDFVESLGIDFELKNKLLKKLSLVLNVLDVLGPRIETAKDIFITPPIITYNFRFDRYISGIEPSCFLNDGKTKVFTIKGEGLNPISDSYWNPFSKPDFPDIVFPGNRKGKVVDYDRDGSWMKVEVPSFEDSGVVQILYDGYLPITSSNTIIGMTTPTINSLEPDEGSAGSRVILHGCGFAENPADNKVEFAVSAGDPRATVIRAEGGTLVEVLAPESVVTGGVTDTVFGKKSNAVPFTVNTATVTFTFGDNGSANDDTFSLSVDSMHIYTMPSPTRSTTHNVELSQGEHTVRLKGITAPDNIGTFYIDITGNATVVSGPSQTGTDLTAGVVKTWTINVENASAVKSVRTDSNRSGDDRKIIDKNGPRILWRE